jgi:hypothetical protein
MDRPVGGARELCHLGRAARPRVQPLERQTVHRAVLPAMAVVCSPWELLVRPQAHGEDEPCTTTGWVPEHPASGVSYSARVLVEHRPPLLRGSGGQDAAATGACSGVVCLAKLQTKLPPGEFELRCKPYEGLPHRRISRKHVRVVNQLEKRGMVWQDRVVLSLSMIKEYP